MVAKTAKKDIRHHPLVSGKFSEAKKNKNKGNNPNYLYIILSHHKYRKHNVNSL